jgi:hypothetical protein
VRDTLRRDEANGPIEPWAKYTPSRGEHKREG